MSIVDERDLRERLDGALDAITPSPAPVGATLRNGKIIRAGRNIGIAAGLAIGAGLVVAAPALLHQPARPGVSPVRPTVMVRKLCPSVPHGVRESARQPELMVLRAGGLPAAELVASGCAWLVP
jgi:hypothetical protein